MGEGVASRDYGLLSSWYEKLEDYTIESAPVNLGEGFNRDFGEAFLKCIESDLYIDVCGRVAQRLLEEYPVLEERLRQAIEEWGAVFVRTDRASPKDACALLTSSHGKKIFKYGIVPLPNTMNNACVSWKPIGAVTLLVSSERVAVMGRVSTLWLRKPVLLKDEVRVFIYRGKPRLVSWYYPRIGAPDHIVVVYENKYVEFISKIIEVLGEENITLDLGLVNHKPVLVELSPFPMSEEARVSTILFQNDFWEQLSKAVKEDKTIFKYPSIDRVIVKKELPCRI